MSDKPNDEGITSNEPAKKPKPKATEANDKTAADPDKKPTAPAKPAGSESVTTDPDAKPIAKQAPANGVTAEKKAKPKKSDGITKEPKGKAETPAVKIQKAGVWGIDLGQCALKAIRLVEEDGKIVATAFDYIEHPKILSQPDADPDQLTREALEKFLARNNLRGDTVCISVPGQSGLARFVKLPPVEEKKITDIVKFEAKQQIPFNLDEVVWDFQKIGSGAVTDGFAMDTEIGLFAMKRDLINRSLQQFIDLAIEVHYVQMAPLALCNFVAFDLLGKGEPGGEAAPDNEKKCVVALDIGADGSNLVITDGERIIWQRPIPLGGNHFTRALTKDLKLTFAKAEHVKRNATKSPDLKKILASLKPVLNDFVGEVQRSIGYFTNTHRDADLEYIIGLGNAFRLPGLQRYLEEKLQITVKKLQKFEHLGGDKVVNEQAFTDNVMSFAVAYGLALQGLEHGRLTTNLLPGEIRIERMVKAKKPWAAAAAAVLLLGLGGVVLGYGIEYKAYSDQIVKKAEDEAKAVITQATNNQQRFTKSKTEAETQAQNVKAVIAGQDEHLNWLELLRFIGDTVPQPDGSNLFIDPVTGAIYDEAQRKIYWDDKPEANSKLNLPGKEAYKALLASQREGRSGDAAKPVLPDPMPGRPMDPMALALPAEQLPPYITDLVQVNIESVDCRFCDDPDAYWTALTKSSPRRLNVGDVFPTKLYDVLPSKLAGSSDSKDAAAKAPGWLVEIRGFTFHHSGRNFICQVFAENIARRGMPDFDNASPDKALPDKKNPILDRVSHVIVLPHEGEGWRKKTTDVSNFEKIGTSFLPDLLADAAQAAAASGMGPAGIGMDQPMGREGRPLGSVGMGMGIGATGREGWSPANGSSSGVGLGVRGERGGPGPMGRGERRRDPGNPGAAVAESKDAPTRTEFVIVFIWREPTPSDTLRGIDEQLKEGATPGAVPGSVPGAPGPPVRMP
jgi:type IV pilus assembly protein PilM